MSDDGQPRWAWQEHRGTVADLHRLEPGAARGRAAWWLAFDRPAVVLGSTQPRDHVDARLAAAEGFEVVRRRSGGGAVVLVPGEASWVDVVVRRDDPWWDDDVGRAFGPVGRWWGARLAAVVTGLAVHDGPLLAGPASSVVCFAGLGPGEITLHGPGSPKLVGLSQRRTRAWARFQGTVHHTWRPDLVAALLAPGLAATGADTLPAVATLGVDADALRELLAGDDAA